MGAPTRTGVNRGSCGLSNPGPHRALTETRKNVGQFSVNFLESDKMLGYWLSFYANRLERTHFVILAELSPKKPTLISILTVLDLMLFNLWVRFPVATFF